MIKQVAHVCFFTRNVGGMLAFYEALGLRRQFTMRLDSGEAFGFYLACGNTTFIELFDPDLAARKWGGRQGLELATGTRYRHLCLEVDDIEATARELAARGIEVTRIATGMDGSRQGWIADPDGNAIELMAYTPRSRQLQPAEG